MFTFIKAWPSRQFSLRKCQHENLDVYINGNRDSHSELSAESSADGEDLATKEFGFLLEFHLLSATFFCTDFYKLFDPVEERRNKKIVWQNIRHGVYALAHAAKDNPEVVATCSVIYLVKGEAAENWSRFGFSRDRLRHAFLDS